MGDVTCFSFDGIKNITSGEGGCIVTDNKKIIDYISDARLLGVERDSMKRYQESRSWEFDVKHQGWRYHMSNIMAAIGIVQLGRFSEFSGQRQLLARKYNSSFKDLDTLKLLPWDYTQVVPHIYPIQIKGLRDRDGLQKILKSKNIQTGFHYQPNHLLSFYRQSKSIYLKNTENIFPELLSLPLHPDLTTKDVDYVAKTLIEYLPDFLF
jgi:dTDP-4-amino-4,6-dideoxygalactose transaminase